jgi:cobalamin transport system substrate-binding protein
VRWKIANLSVVALFGAAFTLLSNNACAAQPYRIVSLAPSITETLFALGAGPEVVGVSQYCDFPKAALKLPKVGSFLTPNVEAILALRPTLIIGLASSSNQRQIRALREMGFATLMVTDDSLKGIENSIGQIGDRIGRAGTARQLLTSMQAHIDAVRARLKGVKSRRVLMMVGHQPMVAVGRGTFLDELLKIAHGVNIADRSPQSWPRLSIEYIIAMAPEVILDGQMGSESAAPSSFWARYPTIPAVRNHHVYGYPQDPMLHPGPRVWQSLEIIASRIHPEAWRFTGGPNLAAIPNPESAWNPGQNNRSQGSITPKPAGSEDTAKQEMGR